MRHILPLVAFATLGGCSLGLSGKAPPFLLTLTPTTAVAADAGRAIKASDSVTIATPIVPQAIASTRVPVADGQNAIAYVKNAVWVEPPARLFQRLLSETIRVRTGRPVFDPRQVAGDAGTQLSGHLLHFGVDARTSEAVVIYDAAVIRDRGKKLETRRFEARSQVTVIDATSSGTALNRAANDVAAQVADWIGRQ
jgi:cholesterol transport system auxiliary component